MIVLNSAFFAPALKLTSAGLYCTWFSRASFWQTASRSSITPGVAL